MKTRIIFIISSVKPFGSVRELIENANRLSTMNCDVTIATPTGEACKWLPCNQRIVTYKKALQRGPVDVVILMQEPFDDAFSLFQNLKAKFKTFIQMGFDQKNHLETLKAKKRNNLQFIFNNYEICADGEWQLKYFNSIGYKNTGVAIGGINTKMFFRSKIKKNIKIGISGDPRPRKRNIVIENMLKENAYDYSKYWGLFDQDKLVNFLQRCNIFMDNHERGGWCNPVLEAMACGAVVICSDVGCNTEFAFHNFTAIKVENTTKEGYALALEELIDDKKKIARLRKNAAREVEKWDYDIITKRFHDYLLTKI